MRMRSMFLLCACAMAGFIPFQVVQSEPRAPEHKTAAPHYWGKVVPAAKLTPLEKTKLRAEAPQDAMALVADNGAVYVLVHDDGSRMLYKDTRLLNRTMRLTAKVGAEPHVLQVSAVNSEIDGKLHDVYYWCEVCKLRFSEPGNCICCGAQTELTEELLP